METIEGLPESKLTKKQVKTKVKEYMEDGLKYKIKVELRFDDECGNGHNSFAVTADIYQKRRNLGDWFWVAGGCQHDEIIKHFPELEPFIKWHLCSTDGPMHYLANTLYHASDKDYNGHKKGQANSFKNEVEFSVNGQPFPIKYTPNNQKFTDFLMECLEMVALGNRRESVFDFEVLEIQHPNEPETYSPNYTWGGFTIREDKGWYDCPFSSEQRALDVLKAFQGFDAKFILTVTGRSEGKEPELEAARNSAIWPEATLEQLQDKQVLIDRLPALMQEFKTDIESLGFTY